MFLQVRKSKHNARLSLHFDKLHVDNIIYVVNEESEEVESIDQDGDDDDEDEDDHWSGVIFIDILLAFLTAISLI